MYLFRKHKRAHLVTFKHIFVGEYDRVYLKINLVTFQHIFVGKYGRVYKA